MLRSDGPIIKISFKMIVENLIDSELMQLIPLEFGQEMVEELLGDAIYEEKETEEVIESSVSESAVDENKAIDSIGVTTKKINQVEKKDNIEQKESVVVKKPNFETFDTSTDISYNESIDLVQDIPVEITVELGRTTKKIGEILEYGPGTVLELDKLVGEPLNLYANGKYIAKGEVVVIDDNFGIRITDINNTYDR